ncbi:MAG TPA: STAS domain-containing protein [Candidatus Eisenbacteria bacterium]|nr:STAS domain-containing protein [Candidatus Eisenbacteria bacterium]
MKLARLHHQEVEFEGRTIDLFEPEGPFNEDTGLALEKAIKALAARGKKDIRVACRRMSYMDSTGLGILIHVAHATRKSGGRFVLDTEATARMRDLLKIVKAQFLEDETVDLGQADSLRERFPPSKP